MVLNAKLIDPRTRDWAGGERENPCNLLCLIHVVAGLTLRKRRVDKASQETGGTFRISCSDPLGEYLEQPECERMLFCEYAGRIKILICDQ